MPKPNTLFLVVDDLNNWVNCLGKYPSAITPNLDRLGARGTVFTNAQCPAPICLPARTAVLSGVSPSTSGCYVNGREIEDQHPWTRAEGMQGTCPMPVHFRRGGYRVMSSGKIYHRFNDEAEDAAEFAGKPNWDDLNARASTMTGMWEFKQSHGVDSRPRDFEPLRDVTEPTAGNMWWGGLDPEQSAVQTDEQTTRYGIEQLQKQHDKPFMLTLGYTRPHTPLVAPQKFFDLYDPEEIEVPEPSAEAFDNLPEFAKQIALNSSNFDWEGGIHHQLARQNRLREVIHAYLAATSFMDDCVGRVLDALDASPYAENTAIVFWSDHGWSLGDHFHWKKWALWECVSNVPLLIARPGDAGGNVVTTPVSTLDLYPTLAELSDLPARPEWEGQSLVPLLDDPRAPWDRPARTTYGPGNHSVRDREATYIRYADGSEELYDPATDPREEKNLADDPAWHEVKQRLAAHLPLPREEALPLHCGGSNHEEQLTNLRAGQVLEFGCVEPGFMGRGFTVEARFELEPGTNDAVILHHNSRFVGYAFYVKDGKPCLKVRNVPRPLDARDLDVSEQTLVSDAPLPEGPVTVRAQLGNDGQGRLWIDDLPAGQAQFSGPLAMHPLGYLSVGHVTERCRLEKPYPLLAELPAAGKEAFPGNLASCSLRRD